MLDAKIAVSRTKRRWPRYVGGGVALLVTAALIWLGYIGAFGGKLYFNVPARGTVRPAVAAIIFSGDMGYRIGMGPKMGDTIAGMGIPVVGVSSLQHFRTRRDPAEIRTYIAAAMAYARRTTGARRLILIGQSYGSDMLHVGLSTLSPADRAEILMVVMVVPTDTVYFQIGPGELTEWAKPDAAALPTARTLTWAPVLCLRGIEERNSLCPSLNMPNVRNFGLRGGHEFNHDSSELSGVLVREISARLGAQD